MLDFELFHCMRNGSISIWFSNWYTPALFISVLRLREQLHTNSIFCAITNTFMSSSISTIVTTFHKTSVLAYFQKRFACPGTFMVAENIPARFEKNNRIKND